MNQKHLSDIKIFVSNRIDLESKAIPNDLYIPIRCGAVFDKRDNVTMLGDDTGDNISEKRVSFCELTVLYWFWKNVKADYVGLCHYRRFLSFSSKKLKEVGLKLGSLDDMSDANLAKIGLLDKDHIKETIEQYDFITAPFYHFKKENFLHSREKNVLDGWIKNVPNYVTQDDFNLMFDSIKRNFPNIYPNAIKIAKGNYFLGFNCFIGKKSISDEMCQFIFGVLFDIEDELKKHGKYRSITNQRVPGYLAEWLYTIYVYHLKQSHKYKMLETQLVGFDDTTVDSELQPVYQESSVIPVVFTADDFNLPNIGVTIQSLLESIDDSRPYDIIILMSKNGEDPETSYVINEEKQNIVDLGKKHTNVSIRFFNPKSQIDKFACRTEGEKSVKTDYYLTLLPWILKKYNKVITLSDQIIVQDSLVKLYQLDLGNKAMAAVRDIYSLTKEGKDYENYDEMEKLCSTFDSGVILWKLDELRKQHKKSDVIISLEGKHDDDFVSKHLNDIYAEQVKYISFEWNYLAVQDFFFKSRLTENLPKIYNDEFSTVKRPRILSLKTNGKSHLFEESRIYHKYMDVAKRTPFYEVLIRNLCLQYGALAPKMSLARRIADKYFPKGSKRRKLIKWFIPRNSPQWNILKRLYHTIAID